MCIRDSTGSLLRSKTEPSVIIQADRKTFTEYGHKISISQIEEIGMFGLEMCIRDSPLTKPYQTPNTVQWNVAVRQWGISFIVERETTQTSS